MGLRTLFARLGVLAALDKAPYPANATKRTAAAEAAVTALDGVTSAEVAAASWADMHGDLPPKCVFLGSAGAVDAIGATTTTANTTTAIYYEVPAGKVAYVWGLKGTVMDSTAVKATSLEHFGARATPAADAGLRLRTVDTDNTTTLNMLAGSINNNLLLLTLTGTPITGLTSLNGNIPSDTNTGALVLVNWRLPSPIVLTAGQRFEIKHLAAVAYTVGVWCLDISEVTL